MIVNCSGGPLNGRAMRLLPEDVQVGGVVELAISSEQVASNKVTVLDGSPDDETHFYMVELVPTLVYQGTRRSSEGFILNRGQVIEPVEVDPNG